MNENLDENGYNLWQIGGFYLLWFISCALCILDLYFASLAVGAVSIRLGADQWNFPAINRCALFGLFAWVTGVQLAFLGLAYLLTYTLPLTR